MKTFIFLFLLFASLTLISAILAINVNHPVHSVLFLILTFCGASGLLILLGVEFFAMLFLIVYVGAVAVLFLFTVLTISKQEIETTPTFLQYSPAGLFLGLLLLTEVILILVNDFVTGSACNGVITFNSSYFIFKATSIEMLGSLLYTYYFPFFILSSIILFIAMIGSIILTTELEKNRNILFQQESQQLSHSFSNAIFLSGPPKN
jgi:NADH:ubiquinone oxidoreductase subunit 6 (subunit J)